LLTGSLEPLSSALGVLLVALHRHPEQRSALRKGILPYATAVEEALRYDSPFHLASRQATADITVGGRAIRRGDRVELVLASANRDERRFTEADEFDIRRKATGPHLAFGRGSHYCLGAALARQEMAALLRALDDQLPTLRIDMPRVSRRPAFGATVLATVPASTS
jgi:cytochrome P450